MSRHRGSPFGASLLTLLGLQAGWVTSAWGQTALPPVSAPLPIASACRAGAPGQDGTAPDAALALFAGMPELSADALVAQVLVRNPSLAEMVAAWQAASARYPQVTSLDDPMLGLVVSPASLGSNNVEIGYRVEIAQKYPFPGKRRLRGEGALAEASAAGHDVEEMRLELAESARAACADYYLAVRALAVNEEGLRLLQQFQEKARERYERVPGANQQDVAQAEVEVGRQRQRLLTLARLRQVTIARINTLLHLPPDSPLPPAPHELGPEQSLPAAPSLRALAIAQRPDLRALADRVRAEQAALGLAHKEYGPDVEVMAAYDTIMGNGPTRDLAAQVGVRLNLPLRHERRAGAVAEAEARVMQRQAQEARLLDQVQYQVQEAYEQALESQQQIRLYRDTLLRAAQKNVEAARSAYEGAKIPFLALIEAQRALVELQDRYYEAVADYSRRLATLERVVGGPLLQGTAISSR